MVQNDILEAFDNRQGVILVLLDQSAAFHTIDHSMLVSHLQRRFGITNIASGWIESYLSGWFQLVVPLGNTFHGSNLTYHTESHKGQCWALCCSPFIRAHLGISFVIMTCAFSCMQMILGSTSVSSLLTGNNRQLLYIRWNIVWPRFVTGWRGIIFR